MAKVAAQYPDDLDAITLYADALFLLEPRRGTRDVNAPNIKRLHGVLESALKIDPKHPGACHLYVHATESTVRPDLAEACAQYLGKTIPGASHINHMPSHTWNEVGRWGDSVRGQHSKRGTRISRPMPAKASRSIPITTCTCCCTPRRWTARARVAMQAGKDYAKRTSDSMYHALTLVRFGRFDEVVELTKRPEREIPAAAFDFAHGLREAEARRAAISRRPIWRR